MHRMRPRRSPQWPLLLLLASCSAVAGVVALMPVHADGIATLRVGSRDLRVSEGAALTIDSGARIWDSGLALSSILGSEPSLTGKRVLELGSGTGVGGLAAAAAGAQVLLSDLPDNVPLLGANIRANNIEYAAQAVQLRWGCEEDEYNVALNGHFDIICGSDILYAPNTFDDLLSTVVKLSTPRSTQLLLTYPTRYTEDIFFDEASAYFEEIETFEVRGLDIDNVWCSRLIRTESQP
eukprot:scaffold314705_cov33-Tisochrysis_lutea.AAC.1